MIAQHEMTIDDYLSILRRRIWLLVIPAVVCAAGAYTVSLFLPSKWTSETVVLVEEPAVPDSIVKPIISGDFAKLYRGKPCPADGGNPLQRLARFHGERSGEPSTTGAADLHRDYRHLHAAKHTVSSAAHR